MPAWQGIAARPSLFGSLAFAAVLFVVLPWPQEIVARALVAWCVFATSFVIVGAIRLSNASADRIRETAPKVDDSAPVILMASLGAAIASIVAVVVELSGIKGLSPGAGAFHLGLTAATVTCSWAFVQVVFAVHYAHEFYGSDTEGEQRSGLDFGQDSDPDFLDFLYFAVTIGATSQTSDVAVRSRTMRRTVLAQAIFSFFFNTMVLALAINIAASLLGV